MTNENKPFDLEAAKAGAKIQIYLANKWIDVHFVGLDRYDNVVIHYPECGLCIYYSDNIRMKPEPRKVCRVIYKDGDNAAQQDFDFISDAENLCRRASAALLPFQVTIEGDE